MLVDSLGVDGFIFCVGKKYAIFLVVYLVLLVFCWLYLLTLSAVTVKLNNLIVKIISFKFECVFSSVESLKFDFHHI